MSAVLTVTVVLLAALALALRWRPPPALATRAGPEGSTRPSARPGPDEWSVVLDAIASEVRAGSSLTNAFRTTVTRCSPRGKVVTPQSTLADVVARSSTDPHEALVIQCVSAAAALGGPMSATLHAGAGVLRQRAAVRAEAAVHSAQARLSARVLTGVPLMFAAWSLLASRSFRAALVSPPGAASAAAGVALNLCGWWWMRRIVDRAAT